MLKRHEFDAEWDWKKGTLTLGKTGQDERMLRKVLKAMEKNMRSDQQERRIMATINGTKVLIVVTRPQSVYRQILNEVKKANEIPEMPKQEE